MTGPAGGGDGPPGALFYLPTLEAGGAERVTVHHVNGLRFFRPVVLAQHLRGDLLGELNPGTPAIDAGERARDGSRPRRSRARRALRRKRRRARIRLRRFDRDLRKGVKKRLGPRATASVQEAERALRAAGRRLSPVSRFRWNLPSRPGGSAVRPPVPRNGWASLPLCVWFLVRQARILARVAREERCGLAVSILPFTNGIAILAKLLFHRRLRVLIHVHSIKSRLIEEETPPMERFLIRLTVRRLYGRADRIVAASEGIRRDLVDRFGAPDWKIRVVPNPIDRERLLALAAEEPEGGLFDDGRPTIAAVGRLVRVKGFDILLRAFARLPAESGTRLVIVGEGEERPNLESLAADIGVADRTVFAGFRANPWSIMARADFLVLSSRTEGLPLVLGEAIALGVPVVAADCSPGIREFVPDESRGLLSPSEDPEALAAAMARMLADPELRRRLAAGAAERIAPYDPARVREAFEREMEEAFGR